VFYGSGGIKKLCNVDMTRPTNLAAAEYPRCLRMARLHDDPRPPFRFDSCPGAVRRGLDGRLYRSTGWAWVQVSSKANPQGRGKP
jgi:hypothetical protein